MFLTHPNFRRSNGLDAADFLARGALSAHEELRSPQTKKAPQGAFFIGGQGGIRTHGTLARTPHFECGAFNHSTTCPPAVIWEQAPDGKWLGELGFLHCPALSAPQLRRG